MKILVVDDEALLVKGIRFNLQSEGYEVITGSDGLEAVKLVQEQKPDLVILDVMMPHMDGLTACSKIREFSDVPIILLTAKTEDMDKPDKALQHSGAQGTHPRASAQSGFLRWPDAGEHSFYRQYYPESGCTECLPRRNHGGSDGEGI